MTLNEINGQVIKTNEFKWSLMGKEMVELDLFIVVIEKNETKNE